MSCGGWFRSTLVVVFASILTSSRRPREPGDRGPEHAADRVVHVPFAGQ